MDPNRLEAENPYAPPKSDVNVGATQAPAVEGELAERGTRFFSQMVDGLIALVVLIPAFIAGVQGGVFHGGGPTVLFRAFTAGATGVVSGLAWLALVLFQAYLVTTTGQSIAKRWFRIKIVKLDGSRVSFVSGVLLRSWLMMVLQQVPGINMFAGLLDALFIFRQDRRCIHDLIAGTKVINLLGATQIRVA
jgi:uncharacterized RDD family membrane protein YckC